MCLKAWLVEEARVSHSEVLARPNNILPKALPPGPSLWRPEPRWAVGLTAAKVLGAVCLLVGQSPAEDKQSHQCEGGGEKNEPLMLGQVRGHHGCGEGVRMMVKWEKGGQLNWQ